MRIFEAAGMGVCAAALSALCLSCDALDRDGDLYAWHAFYGGAQGWDSGYAVASDRDGNVYVTGFSETTWDGPDGQASRTPVNVGSNIFVLKLDARGAYQWHAFFGHFFGNDRGVGDSIAVDGDGNVYVAGESSESWNGPDGHGPVQPFSEGTDGTGDPATDGFVLKLGPDGEYLWHTFFGGTDDDAGGTLRLDASGRIYVAGYSNAAWDGPSGQAPRDPFAAGTDEYGQPAGDALLVALAADGAYEWHAFYGADRSDGFRSLRLDGSGNVYASGVSKASWDGPDGQGPLHAFVADDDGVGVSPGDLFVLKLDPGGAYLWHTFYADGSACAVDESGNVFVTGAAESGWDGPDGELPLHPYAGARDVVVLSLDADGAYLWHAFFGGARDESGSDIEIGADGSLYVAGGADASWDGPDGEPPLSLHAGGFDELNERCSDALVLALDAAGAYQWHAFYGGGDSDHASSLSLDGNGGVYVAGESDGAWKGHDGASPVNPYSGEDDILVLKLTD